MGSTENCQIDLEKLFTDGFSTETGSMREPQSIMTYAMLTIIAIAGIQKDQNSGASIPAFDYYMAPGVLKTFKKEFRESIYELLEYTDYDKFIAINGIEREIDKLSTIDFDIEEFYKFTRGAEELKRMFRIVYQKALEKTNKATYQSMEALIHDLNSLCNSDMTTINLGTDTSKEGRMVTLNLLQAIESGIGENKKVISPKIIFKIKNGVNFKKADPNYDLLEKATKLVEKINNVSFSFLDSQYNSQYYKEGDFNTEVAYFANGGRVIDNYVDEDKITSVGRGNLSTTTINLPRIALKHKDNIDDFYEELNQKMELAKDQLIERLEIQENKKVYNFPILMKQNIWIDSEKLKEDDKLKKILKQGALKISFTGLNETLIVLTGKNHAESKKAQDLGIKIIATMRQKTDEYSKKYNLNFLLCGDNNKNIAKTFLEFDRIIFGKIKDSNDKERYTTSFNLPDEYDTEKKIRIESAYHEYTNGGHFTRVRSEDIMQTLEMMYKNEIGFGMIEINKKR